MRWNPVIKTCYLYQFLSQVSLSITHSLVLKVTLPVFVTDTVLPCFSCWSRALISAGTLVLHQWDHAIALVLTFHHRCLPSKQPSPLELIIKGGMTCCRIFNMTQLLKWYQWDRKNFTFQIQINKRQPVGQQNYETENNIYMFCFVFHFSCALWSVKEKGSVQLIVKCFYSGWQAFITCLVRMKAWIWH